MNEQIIPLMQQVMDSADVIDLSYTMEPGMPVWPTHARFGAIIYETYDEGAVSLHRQINFGEHTGTHLDKPKHFIKGGASIEEVDVRTVIGRGVKIDASFLEPCGYIHWICLRSLKKKTEKSNRETLSFCISAGKKNTVQEKMRKNFKKIGQVWEDAAQYLLDKKVASVGTDALALDPFGSETYPCHYILLGSGVPIIENLTNLRKLPVFSYVIGLANKIKDGSASPIRVIALT